MAHDHGHSHGDVHWDTVENVIVNSIIVTGWTLGVISLGVWQTNGYLSWGFIVPGIFWLTTAATAFFVWLCTLALQKAER